MDLWFSILAPILMVALWFKFGLILLYDWHWKVDWNKRVDYSHLITTIADPRTQYGPQPRVHSSSQVRHIRSSPRRVRPSRRASRVRAQPSYQQRHRCHFWRYAWLCLCVFRFKIFCESRCLEIAFLVLSPFWISPELLWSIESQKAMSDRSLFAHSNHFNWSKFCLSLQTASWTWQKAGRRTSRAPRCMTASPTTPPSPPTDPPALPSEPVPKQVQHKQSGFTNLLCHFLQHFWCLFLIFLQRTAVTCCISFFRTGAETVLVCGSWKGTASSKNKTHSSRYFPHSCEISSWRSIFAAFLQASQRG